MSVSSFGNSSRISRYSLTEEDDYEEDQVEQDKASTTSIKMRRCDLIAQLERLGYEDVPEDVVQEFIAELKSQNIEVLEDDMNATQISSSLLPDDEDDHDNEEEEVEHYDEDEHYEEEQAEEDEEESEIPITESEQDDMNAFLPVYTPILHNNDDDEVLEDDEESVPITKSVISGSFHDESMLDDGYDTATYYGKHYSSITKEDIARDSSFNSSFNKQNSLPVNNTPYSPPKFSSPMKNTNTPKKIETLGYPFISSPNRKSHDVDDYHRPQSSRDVSHHDLQTPTSKVKFKPLEERNYTPPSLPLSRPKSAPPTKTPVKEPIIKTPSKSDTAKENFSPSPGKNTSLVRTSTSSSIQSTKPLPFKSNAKKPVSYRKKVNDPVNRWREMNAMWKNDPFLKNQQSQQKSHRWRVRQEMLEIQGDKYLNPKESR